MENEQVEEKILIQILKLYLGHGYWLTTIGKAIALWFAAAVRHTTYGTNSISACWKCY